LLTQEYTRQTKNKKHSGEHLHRLPVESLDDQKAHGLHKVDKQQNEVEKKGGEKRNQAKITVGVMERERNGKGSTFTKKRRTRDTKKKG